MSAAALAVAALLAAPAPLHELRPGAPELVVLPVPEATTASLRVVVRAGSALDPPGKEGLAHLLEHAILEGTDRGRGLLDAARAQGAAVEGWTGRDATVYQLDAPAEAFAPLAERLLRAVTSPRIDARDLPRQQGVVGSEDRYATSGRDAARYLETAIFSVPEASSLGTVSTRAAVKREDLLDWFRRHYLTSAVTVILAGGVTEPQARALLRRSFLLPPALPEEVVPSRPMEPVLPVTQRIAAPYVAVIHGFRLAEEERASCAALAALVELRLLTALHIREPLLSPPEARCVTLRGATFLVAFGYAATLDAPDLPERVAEVFRDVARSEATPAERRLLQARAAAQHRLRSRDPVALADEAVRLAAQRDGPPVSPAPAPFDAARVRAAAARAFVPARQLAFILSPFGQ